MIIDRLQPEPGVYVYPREERIAAYEKLSIPETAMVSRATALKLGWDAGADNIVTGSFSGTPDKFQIVARFVDMEAGAAIEVKSEGKLEDVIPLTMSLAWQLLRRIVPGTASPESDYTARPPTRLNVRDGPSPGLPMMYGSSSVFASIAPVSSMPRSSCL